MILKQLFKGIRAKNKRSLRRYEAKEFILYYPDNWRTCEENGIFNFHPDDDLGAVTISSYNDFPFPYEETKKHLLEMNQVTGSLELVKEVKKGKATEYSFEYFEGQTKWFVKGIRIGF
jgi:hypothetical protein